MSNNVERRHDRQVVTLMVDYAGQSDLSTDFTENLSMGGTFVCTERELQPDSHVRLLLSCPGLIEPIALEGVVRWVRPAGEQGPGCGIEFTNYDEAARDRLRSIIDGLAVASDEGPVVRLLVVEDNSLIVNLLRDGLTLGRKHLGSSVTFKFTVATDGQSALELLAAETFDVALVDMYLPVVNGSQVIKTLRADARTQYLPVIAISAGGRDAADLALEAGADRFLSKPIRLKEVLDAIGGVITVD